MNKTLWCVQTTGTWAVEAVLYGLRLEVPLEPECLKLGTETDTEHEAD